MNMISLIKQDFRNLVTNPAIVVFAFVYPALLIGLFGFLFSSLYGSDGVTSYDFYGVTMMFYLILNAVTIAPNAFMDERIKQGNIRVAYSPVSRISIYSSKLLTSFLFMGTMFTLDIIIFSKLNIVNFGKSNILYVLILFWALLLFTTTLGGAVCVLVKSEQLTNMVLSLLVNVIALFSGIFFPIDGLGQFASKLSQISPLKWVLDSVFSIIYDGNFIRYTSTLLLLVLLSMVFVIIVHFNYRSEDYI